MFFELLFWDYFKILSFLSIIIIISSLMLLLSINPIHSLLFLVLIFLITTCIFLIFKIEFISMLFLVVYLGAIIVLFLFVVMMLNIRILSLNNKIITYFPLAFFIFFGFFLEILYILYEDFILNNNMLLSNYKNINASWFWNYPKLNDLIFNGLNQNIKLLSTLTNLHNIAIILYIEYMHVFILGSVILLIGMLGAIILTLQNTNKIKKQEYYFQNYKSIKKSINKIN